MPRFLVGQLADHMAGRPGDDLVFRSPKGAVLRVRGARRSWFDQVVKRAGLPKGFHPHELRHTAASLAVSAGANVKAVQRMLGHAKASMTLDVYADLFDDDLEAVADRLDEIASRADSVWTGEVITMSAVRALSPLPGVLPAVLTGFEPATPALTGR
ncbi:MAG TPA: site-specific integrase [Micromonosporaceae bacterium]